MQYYGEYRAVPDRYHRHRGAFERMTTGLFYVMLFLLPFSEVWIDREEGTGAFLTILILLFGAMSIFNWRSYYRYWSTPIVLLASFIVLTTFSDCLSMGGVTAVVLLTSRQFLVNVYFALIVYNIVRANQVNVSRVVFFIVLGGCISALFVVLGLGVKEGVEHGVTGVRYSVLGQNSNGTARAIGMSLLFVPFIVLDLISLRRILKVGLLILAPICVYGMMKVSSRGGTLALLLACPFIVFVARTANKKLLCFGAMALFVAGLVIAVLNSEMLANRIVNTLYNRDTGGREVFFYGCLEIWKNAKWIGHGSITYTVRLAEWVFGFYWRNNHIASHCMYTFPLAAGGVLGCLLYFSALSVLFRKAMCIRQLPYGNFVFVVFLYICIGGITANIEFMKANFLVFGLIDGIYYHYKNHNKVKPFIH